MKTLLILGATGKVGQKLLELALTHPDISHIVAPTRRSSEMIERDTARPMPAEAKTRLKRELLNQLDRG